MARVTILLRRGTTSQWEAADPILAAGEPGVDIESGILKIGDGMRRWVDLPSYGDDTAADVAYLADLVSKLASRVALLEGGVGSPVILQPDPVRTGFLNVVAGALVTQADNFYAPPSNYVPDLDHPGFYLIGAAA